MHSLADALSKSLDVAKKGPKPLADLARLASLVHEEELEVTEGAVVEAVAHEGEGGTVRHVLRQALARWDHDGGSEWAGQTAANTRSRRELIYDLMDLSQAARELLDDRVPFFPAEAPIVIAADRWEPWYTTDRTLGHSFYWDALCRQLREQLGWPEESVLSLDRSTTAVVERLSDPLADEAYQSKGLVVGYVQSGKTANITGVIAKAADVGYRLVIVLAGTLNILREQTQRRLDRELVGREVLDDEYVDDAEWAQFIAHGARPSTLGAFDWTRLTSRSNDYRKLTGGQIDSLRFVSTFPDRPLNDADNLHRCSAKLIVVKKHAGILEKLAADLDRVDEGGFLAQVPALIIDDESDQASVNTIRPDLRGDETDSESEEAEKQRTRTNGAIVELLRRLPRAQYVGYTATPFANVFVDPGDSADLFPRDFIIGLPRPSGYLGASDFHDLDGTPPDVERNPFASNARSFVRPVWSDDADRSKLQEAIDSFFLSGALKLFRASRDTSLHYRHHTLMIHTSPRVADHQGQLDAVREILSDGRYRMGGATGRLRHLFETDFAPVSAARAPTLPFPTSFDELEEHFDEVFSRLYRGDEPILMVNSTNEASKLAFDSAPVWKIIVGGAKLSRGFTVEGLTVSYFRRRSPTADTLMQMGRWCGFRRGYADLVRLYIGRREETAHETIDVYEAFEGVCRDEEAFRGELRRYSMPENGDRPITPMDVPPLVRSHLEWVRPTSRNKMYNARLQFRNFGDQWSEHRRVAQTPADRQHNERLFRDLLIGRTTLSRLEEGARRVTMHGAVIDAASVLDTLGAYRWANRSHDLALELEFLRGHDGDPEIDDWFVALPQLAGPSARSWTLGEHELSVHRRSYWQNTPPLVNAYAGADERALAEIITMKRTAEYPGSALRALRSERRGVMLIYPIVHDDQADEAWVPTLGFSLLFPPNHIPRRVGFTVANSARPDEPIVDAG